MELEKFTKCKILKKVMVGKMEISNVECIIMNYIW